MDMSFGKFYAKTFTGSMYGAGPGVFALWAYCIANARPPDGRVEINAKLLSDVLGMSEPDVDTALTYLQAPDARSRSPEEDGRRLIHVAGFEYRLPTFCKHRDGTDMEGKRAYDRQAQRNRRARVKRNVNDSQGQSYKQKQKHTTRDFTGPLPPGVTAKEARHRQAQAEYEIEQATIAAEESHAQPSQSGSLPHVQGREEALKVEA